MPDPTPLERVARRRLNARRLTAKQLDQAAGISATDVYSARAAWRTDAPKRFRDLLDARAAERTTT